MKQEQQEQLDKQINYNLFLAKTTTAHQSQCSEYYEEYTKAFENLSQSNIDKEALIKILISKGFEYTNKRDYLFGVKVIRYTPNYEVICLKVKYGPFSFECNILNVPQKSSVHSLPQIKSSEGCCIYLEPTSLNNTVIKCFPMKQNCFQELLIKVIRQYTIFRIASCLGIGPQQGCIKSFQILVYEDCIQFLMEECKITQQLAVQSFQGKNWDKLKEKLNKLHQLQIVHMDIKPSNICFSPSTNELVFIDFGLSDIVEELIGFKTETHFSGTLNYCSPDMKECYNSSSPKEIDLYYNDLYGLIASHKELLANQIVLESSDSQQSLPEIDYDHTKITEKTKNNIKTKMNLFKLKYLIYIGDINAIMSSQLYQQYLIYYCQQILSFIYQVPYGVIIEKIYRFIKSKKNEAEYLALNNQSAYNYSIFKLQSTEDNQNQKLFRYFIKGLYLSKTELNNYKIEQSTDDNIKMLLLDQKNIISVKKTVYFQKLSQFISLKVILSTFDEKIAALRILDKIYRINLSKDDDDIEIFKKGSLYLLEYFIYQQKISFRRQIPLLFFNVVILVRSHQFISQIFMRIAKKQMKIEDSELIIIKCYNCCFWFQQFTFSIRESKQLFDRILQICKETFRNKLKMVSKDDNNYQCLKLIFQILNCHQCHHVPLILNQKSSQIQKMKYVEEQLRHQILNYIQSLLIEDSSGTRILNCNSAINQVTLIDQASLYSNKKQLEYSYCLFFNIFLSNNNNKGMSAIIYKISKYFGTNSILELFYIYQQYVQREFNVSGINKKAYLQSVIKIIRRDPQDKQGRLIHYYNPIYRLLSSRQTHNLDQQSIQLMKIIGKHMLDLFKIVPREQIKQIIVKYKKMKDHEQWLIHYVTTMIGLHSKNPYFSNFLKKILEIYEQQFLCKNCTCKQDYNYLMMILKTQFLKYTRNYEEMFDLLDQCIANSWKSCKKRMSITCMFDMITFLETRIDLKCELQKRVCLVIDWIDASQTWEDLLYKHIDTTKDFLIVYGYLLQNKMNDFFCRAQYKLTTILAKYPSQQIMLVYSQGLQHAFLNWYTKISDVAEYMSKSYQLKKRTDEINQYYAIFVSYLLLFKHMQEKPENGFILFIFKKINKLNSIGKQIVRKNLLFYLARISFINYKENVSKRRAKNIWRMYFRVPLVHISSDQLQKYYLNNIKNKQIPKTIKRKILTKSVQLEGNVNFWEANKCKSLKKLFTSPFCQI